MPGLTTVAAALNANDQALASIAAVHLRIPDLPDQSARDELEAEDVLIKCARNDSRSDMQHGWAGAIHKASPDDPQREEGLKILRKLNIIK
jgi:hypothetical protein